MALSQYKETFQKQQIDGAILVQSDEDLFKEELIIGNRIHRLKLLAVASGKKSVQSLMGHF